MKISQLNSYNINESFEESNFDDFLNSFLDIKYLNEAPVRKSNGGRGPVMTKGNVKNKKKVVKKQSSGGILPWVGAAAMALGGSHMMAPVDPENAPNVIHDTEYTQEYKPKSKTGGPVKLYGPDGKEVGTEVDKQLTKSLKAPVSDTAKNDSNTYSPYAKDHPDKKPFYKIGTPYQKYGVTYKPKFDPDYKKVGLASWYGPGFDGRLTANHDTFDTSQMTAAHPTLPIPSVVTVTNLDNGKSTMVLINDRGPYHPGRIIDVSKAAAEKLGIIQKGTGKVKVKYEPVYTEKYLKKAGLYDQYKQVALNKK